VNDRDQGTGIKEQEPTQPFLFAPDSTWIEVRDGDVSGRAMYGRHYSKHHYRDGRKPALFVGPGFKIVLLTYDARALFVWRKFKDASLQVGINCSVFRNEGAGRASDLITAADAIAFARWPEERHYTYVNRKKIRPTRQPGRCFLKAGWKYCRDEIGGRLKTKGGLFILELRPEWRPL
jgi:hypothetical protein